MLLFSDLYCVAQLITSARGNRQTEYYKHKSYEYKLKMGIYKIRSDSDEIRKITHELKMN